MSFPTIWCGQQRPSSKERTRIVHTSDIFKAELRNVDHCVCLNIPNIFWKAKHLQVTQVASKVTLALRRVLGTRANKVTASQLLDENLQNAIPCLDEGYNIFRTIRSSPPYFELKKKELLAMVRQLQLPTLFCLLSSADTNWVPLLQSLGFLVKDEVYSAEHIATEMTIEDKLGLVAAHPAACSRYFHDCVQKFFSGILQSPCSPLGKLQEFFYHVEFQKRGSPHIHGLLWIADAPRFGVDSNENVCEYIDKCISCCGDVTDVEKPFLKFQIHRHSISCKKIVHGKCTCRFGAPWPPIKNNSDSSSKRTGYK